MLLEDKHAVTEHPAGVAISAGSIDILVQPHLARGQAGHAAPVEDYTRGPHTALTSQFTTVRAAARHMVQQGRGIASRSPRSPAPTPIPRWSCRASRR